MGGEVIYSTVNRNNTGEGLVEFGDREAMEYALKELDDTKLDGKRIKLIQEERSPSRSRSNNRREARRGGSNRSRSQERKKRHRSRSHSPLNNDGSKSRSRSNRKEARRY